MTASVTRTLRDANGRPIAGATVSIYLQTGALATLSGGNPKTTDSAGQWTAALATDSYIMLIQKGADFTSRPLDICEHEVEPDGRTRTVVDSKYAPVAAAKVWIYDGADLVDLDEGNPLITDRHGRWTADLDAGDYQLLIEKDGATLSVAITVCDTGAETFYILTEAGDRITAEDDSPLLQEDAP